MYEVIFLLVLAIIWIIAASVQDLKQREVANWLSFSLIAFALGFRFFYSVFNVGSSAFFYQGLIGLAIFFIIGNLLYYGRVFAGGDGKLMIALGTVLPFSESFWFNMNVFVLFLVVFLITGAIYGFIFSGFLALRNLRGFKKEFNKRIKQSIIMMNVITAVAVIIIGSGFIMLNILIFALGVLVLIMPYLYIYAKSVEEACMIKKVAAKNLTVGDWLYQDVRIGKRTIKANWEGLSDKEIKLIKKHKKSVLIKQGIPFVPVFLNSFLVLIYLYFVYGLTIL